MSLSSPCASSHSPRNAITVSPIAATTPPTAYDQATWLGIATSIIAAGTLVRLSISLPPIPAGKGVGPRASQHSKSQTTPAVPDLPSSLVKMTLTTALASGSARLAHLASARRDAELLLMRAAEVDRAFLLTHPEAPMTPEQAALYNQWIERRAQHEPVQYITREQEFYGLPLRVTPDVLIPRPETEHLVESALDRLPHNAPVTIADVGTGSGAIAIALAHS